MAEFEDDSTAGQKQDIGKHDEEYVRVAGSRPMSQPSGWKEQLTIDK